MVVLNLCPSQGSLVVSLIGFHIGPIETIQVLWGTFKIFDIESSLKTHWKKVEGKPSVQFMGNVKRKYEKKAKKIADEIRQMI